MKNCKHWQSCRHFCALTETCDYLINMGRRRPFPAAACPGYPKESERARINMCLPGSWIYDDNGNPVKQCKEEWKS